MVRLKLITQKMDVAIGNRVLPKRKVKKSVKTS
jgi:hypothetical protein